MTPFGHKCDEMGDSIALNIIDVHANTAQSHGQHGMMLYMTIWQWQSGTLFRHGAYKIIPYIALIGSSYRASFVFWKHNNDNVCHDGTYVYKA